MRKRNVGIVLASSIFAGIGAGFLIDSMVSEETVPISQNKTNAPVDAIPSTQMTDTAVKEQAVIVKYPILVTNRDGTATLSATLMNVSDRPLRITAAWVEQQSEDNPTLLLYGQLRPKALKPGTSTSIGGINDSYRIRLRDRTAAAKLTISLGFDVKGMEVSFNAPVVQRSETHAGIADNGPNTQIEIRDAKIVVVPGQDKAFIGGRIVSTIDDAVYQVPTAIDQNGRQLALRHQTATGGPYGIVASSDQEIPLGGPPFLATEGDADYFLAKDVTIGETVMVTIQFPSGDVVTPFKVVQARADGTI